MLQFWLVFGLLIMPFILVCLFFWLNIRFLNLQNMIEEDIFRLEQKIYYLEKLILLLTSNNSTKDFKFNDLLALLMDESNKYSNWKKYGQTKKSTGGWYEKKNN